MSIKKFLILIFVFVFLIVSIFGCGCYNEPKGKVSTSNPNYNVYLLFEVDGCKVYKFSDGGRTRYFTNCQGSVSWSEKHGKNPTIDVEIQTSADNRLIDDLNK